MLKGGLHATGGGQHARAAAQHAGSLPAWGAPVALHAVSILHRQSALLSLASSSGTTQPHHHHHHQRRRLFAAAAAAAADAVPELPGGGKAGAGAAAAAGAGAGPVPVSVPADTATDVPPRDLSLEPFRALVAGRRFHCTMCGKCCTGDGEIWVSPEEAARIARHLNLSLQRFLDTHTKQYSKYKGWRMLKTAEGSSSCIFLGADNKCSIHTVRPSQCSTYPWWPELTLDSEWDWEKANICEGFDHPEAGPLDVEEAARQLREANKMTQLRLLASEVRITPKVASWADQVLIWDEDEPEAEQWGGSGGGGDSAERLGPKGAAGGKGGKGKGGGGGGGGGGDGGGGSKGPSSRGK